MNPAEWLPVVLTKNLALVHRDWGVTDDESDGFERLLANVQRMGVTLEKV